MKELDKVLFIHVIYLTALKIWFFITRVLHFFSSFPKAEKFDISAINRAIILIC